MRIAHFILFSLLLTSQVALADYQFNLTPGVTPVSHDIYDLHMTIFWICVAIGVVVFGVMLYSIIFHRKSLGAVPAHFHEHTLLEFTWSLIPLVILIFMAVPATRVLIDMADTEKPDVTIKVTGFQWKWKYEYIDQGISFFSNNATPYEQMNNKAPKDKNYLRIVDKPLVVPIHKKIRFLVTGNDVIHSWWVPDLGVKRDAVPGFINEAWARINRAGTYQGQCAELCGLHHAFMPIVVNALPEKDFDAWVAQQKAPAQPAPSVPTPTAAKPATTPAPAAAKSASAAKPAAAAQTSAASGKKTMQEQMQQGEKIFLGTCAVCHQPGGEGMPPTFPALKGSPIATGPLSNHLDRVLNGKAGTAMQAFKDQFNDDDLAAVITYERNAFGNNKGDVVQPEQVKAARG